MRHLRFPLVTYSTCVRKLRGGRKNSASNLSISVDAIDPEVQVTGAAAFEFLRLLLAVSMEGNPAKTSDSLIPHVVHNI